MSLEQSACGACLNAYKRANKACTTQTINHSWASCNLIYPASIDSKAGKCVELPMSQGNVVDNQHANVTLVCCVMPPTPSTIFVLQAKQGVLPRVGAGKQVRVMLSLCIGFFTDKVRSARAAESA